MYMINFKIKKNYEIKAKNVENAWLKQGFYNAKNSTNNLKIKSKDYGLGH